MKKTLFFVAIAVFLTAYSPFWGFFAHEKINRLAVFTLPPEMIGFYKANIGYLTKASTDPDRRRYAIEGEAARHFLDVDHYGDSALYILPHHWDEAEKRYGTDSLEVHGVLPWHIFRMYLRLREAFLVSDPARILQVSSELGHYIADAHVPLHTTRNYNGQLTGQEGIHGFWESRLPEIFSGNYNFFVGRADYISNPQAAAWQIISSAHQLVKKVLAEEKQLGLRFAEKKYAFETRGYTTVKVYAIEYATAYHQALDGMVETQMRSSVKKIGDFWYTAWIDAGQPDLRRLIDHKPSEEELNRNRIRAAEWKAWRSKVRDHE